MVVEKFCGNGAIIMEFNKNLQLIEDAKSAIVSRLLNWGQNNTVNGELFTDENGWLPKEVSQTTRYLVERFYFYYGKKRIKDMGLLGWECGLGQILDIRDQRIAAILPYLLTAYMYNFRSCKYLTGFLSEKNFPPKWTMTLENDFFFGICMDKEYVKRVKDVEFEEVPAIWGIGKCFTGSLSDNVRKRQQMIDSIAQLFAFPETEIIYLSDQFAPVAYVVPIKDVPVFEKKVKVKKRFVWDEGTPQIIERQVYIEPNGRTPVEYKRDTYELIFAYWYYVIKSAFNSQDMSHGTRLVCPPYAKASYELLQIALKRVSSDTIQNLDNDHIGQELHRMCQNDYKNRHW